MIKVKRVYSPIENDDGVRVLVDRIWPRGIKKEEADIDFWFKEIAPSKELRKWFKHDSKKWEEFKTRYFEEIKAEMKRIEELSDIAKKQNLTLLYGAKEERYNNAIALKEFLGDQK